MARTLAGLALARLSLACATCPACRTIMNTDTAMPLTPTRAIPAPRIARRPAPRALRLPRRDYTPLTRRGKAGFGRFALYSVMLLRSEHRDGFSNRLGFCIWLPRLLRRPAPWGRVWTKATNLRRPR